MLDRITEMLEAAQAREGDRNDMEKAAMWSGLFLNITALPIPSLIRHSIIDQIADLIKLYHGEDTKKFLNESLNPAINALRSDIHDFWKASGRD